ncbi:MAG TPA: ribosome maturation factor RimP [Nocardioidaceae bacterium]|nr:ribosome maturation factor RimP [Nocardioidaceae bacterium]
MADDETRDRLSSVLTEPLLALGLDLEAIEITPAGKRKLLRVAVDQDGGVTLDDIAGATKEVSRILDETDVMGDRPYLLEVSSPGIDRPLTLPRHFRRNQARLVKITTSANETITGRIVEAGDDAAVLDVNGKTRSITYTDVTKARVQVEFNRKEPEA